MSSFDGVKFDSVAAAMLSNGACHRISSIFLIQSKVHQGYRLLA